MYTYFVHAAAAAVRTYGGTFIKIHLCMNACEYVFYVCIYRTYLFVVTHKCTFDYNSTTTTGLYIHNTWKYNVEKDTFIMGKIFI